MKVRELITELLEFHMESEIVLESDDSLIYVTGAKEIYGSSCRRIELTTDEPIIAKSDIQST